MNIQKQPDIKVKQPKKYFRSPKDFFVLLVGLISLFYLMNMGFGLVELIPDALPFVGNIDEAIATTVLLFVCNYFGIPINRLFNRK